MRPGELGETMGGPEGSDPELHDRWGSVTPGNHRVELVGPHLRVRGVLSLGRFSRLADLVNHNRSFIILREAQLLDHAGEPIAAPIDELAVNQDAITFIGHGGGAQVAGDRSGAGHDHPSVDGTDARPGHLFVILTAGHAISGSIHIYREMTLANFVEASDPRFLPMTDATARSLVHDSMPSWFQHLLVNRTQISAIAESARGAEIAEAAVQGRQTQGI